MRMAALLVGGQVGRQPERLTRAHHRDAHQARHDRRADESPGPPALDLADAVGNVERKSNGVRSPLLIAGIGHHARGVDHPEHVLDGQRARYESNLAKHVYDELGACRLSEVRRRDVQALADRLVRDGASGSKVRNVVTALKVVYRRELEHDDLAVNPTTNLRLPDVEGTRDWDATPEEALALLEALPEDEKALYATALLAGLRRGELRALRISGVQGLD